MGRKEEGVEYGTKTKTYVSKTFAMPPTLHKEFIKLCENTGQCQTEFIIEAIKKHMKTFRPTSLE